MLPLKYNEKENEFKIYLNDIGLLMSLFGKETKRAFLNNTLKGSAKGGIFENFIAGELVKKGYLIHYYKPNDTMELEFILEKDGGVVPIEVKEGNTATVSLNKYIEQNKPYVAYKFIAGNVGLQDVKLSLPHYMILFI